MGDQITANQKRTVILLGGFVAFIVMVVALVGLIVGSPAIGLAVGLLLAVGLAVGSYLYSGRVALSISKARPASAAEYPRYHNLVEGLCVSGGLPKPELFIIDDDAPNSFATGRSPDHAAVAVTTGLLEKLNRIELEGVLAHELAHIANRDTALTSIAVTLVGLGIPMATLSGKVMELAASRRREGEADLTGVRMTRYPPGLIAALEKLRADKTVVQAGSRATAHLWIEAPGHKAELDGRIAALRDL